MRCGDWSMVRRAVQNDYRIVARVQELVGVALGVVGVADVYVIVVDYVD